MHSKAGVSNPTAAARHMPSNGRTCAVTFLQLAFALDPKSLGAGMNVANYKTPSLLSVELVMDSESILALFPEIRVLDS